MKPLQSIFLLFFIATTFLSAQPVVYHLLPSMAHITDYQVLNDGSEIWISTYGGVTQYLNHGSSIQNHYPSGNPRHYESIRKSGSYVVAGGPHILSIYNGSSWSNYDNNNSNFPQSSGIREVEMESGGIVWVRSYNDSIFAFSNGNFTPQGIGSSIAVHPTLNQVFIGTSSFGTSVIRIQNGQRDSLPLIPGGITENFIKRIEFVDGKLWAHSLKGVHAFSNGQWTTYFSEVADDFAPFGNSCIIEKSGIWIKSTPSALDTLGSPTHSRTGFSQSHVGSLKSSGGNVYFSIRSAIAQCFTEMMTDRSFGELSNSTMRVSFTSDGGLFQTLDKSRGLVQQMNYLNAGSVFAANLWMKGEKNGSLLTHSETYRSNDIQYFSGPYSDSYDSSYIARYDRVWSVTREQVDRHIAMHSSPFYTMPTSIATWPGNGDVAKNEGATLAPFVDVDFNGVYEPEKGDYPEIRGHQCSYFIFNDFRGFDRDINNSNAGLEIHCMAFSFDTVDVAISNSLFLSYRVINRSLSPINNMRLGIWADYDLGFASDDLIASDSVLSVSYVRNSDSYDEGPLGYGDYPPAFGLKILSEDASGHMYYTNTTSWINGNPDDRLDIQNLMRQRFYDGTPLRLEPNGDGYDPSGTYPITRWAYNDGIPWNIGGNQDLRSVTSTERRNLYPLDEWCLDVVFVGGRDTISTALLASTNVMKSHIRAVDSFYQSTNFACLSEGVDIPEQVPSVQFNIYPNPVGSTRTVMVTADQPLLNCIIYNMQGQLITTKNASGAASEMEIQLSHLPAGGYMIQINTRQGVSRTEILIVE